MLARYLLLLAVLAFAGDVAAQEAGEEPQISADRVNCMTCTGNGQTIQECWKCKGEGTHVCHGCADFTPTRAARWRIMWAPPDLLKRLDERFTTSVIQFKPFPQKGRPKSAKIRPGDIRCPAKCVGGKLSYDCKWADCKWTDCKLCRGGKSQCKLCRRGRLKCRNCAGSGRALDSCVDCAGLGSLPNPYELQVESCPWSPKSGRRPCGTCDDAGQVRQPCKRCCETMRVLCGGCLGVGKTVCKLCGGRGRQQNSTTCAGCRDKGVFDCDDECEKGVLRCPDCLDETPLVDCHQCLGAKEHPCNGCMPDDYLAWDYTARWFQGRGEFERAGTWLEEARQRCERRYDNASKVLPAMLSNVISVEEIERALDKWRKAEFHRLDRIQRDFRKEAAKEAGAVAE